MLSTYTKYCHWIEGYFTLDLNEKEPMNRIIGFGKTSNESINNFKIKTRMITDENSN